MVAGKTSCYLQFEFVEDCINLNKTITILRIIGKMIVYFDFVYNLDYNNLNRFYYIPLGYLY